MPVLIPEALARATPLLLGRTTHPDYERTVEYAILCHRLETGDVATLLRRFHARESQAEYDARVNLTVSTLPALWSEIRTPFYKVSRLKGSQVERRFEYADAPSEAERARRVDRLLGALSTYHAGKGLEDYLSDTVVRLWALSDPNAWLLTEFGSFDFRTGRARPYPVVLPARSVVDFTREAGVVSSLTVRLPVETGVEKGDRYTVYLDNEALDYWPVLPGPDGPVSTLPAGSAVAGTVADATGKVLWQYRILRHGAGRVPASPLGYVPDPQTEGRTCVSPLDPALCFLLKEVHTGSELDIVMARTVHPHKSQYVAACRGYAQDGGCREGIATNLNGTGEPGPCRLCNGTRLPATATSATDVTTYPLPPTSEEFAKLPKLGDMVDFKIPPIEVPRFQLEYSEHLRARIHQTLFNAQAGPRTTSAPAATATATERLQQAEQLNIALSPLADFLAGTYQHHGLVSAAYVDVAAGLSVTYRYPADLLPPNLSDLLEQYAAAVAAGTGPEFLELLYKRIVRQQLADAPETLRRLEIRWRFVSYVGVPDERVERHAVLGFISAESRTLRIEQDRAFYELERDRPDFYELAPSAQQPLVDAKVRDLLALLPGAGGGAFPKLSFNQPAPV